MYTIIGISIFCVFASIPLYINHLKKNISISEEKVTDLSEEVLYLQKSLQKKREKIYDQEDYIDDVNQENVTLKLEIQELTENNEELKNLSSEAQDETESLKKTIEENEEEISSLVSQVGELEQELEELKEKHQDIMDRVADHEEVVADLVLCGFDV